MSEGPYPEVPRIAGPVTGITGVGAVGAEERRRRQKDAPKGPPVDPGPEGDPPTGVEHPPVPPDPLIEALDRLRTTTEERPAEDEVLRLLRGRKLYEGPR